MNANELVWLVSKVAACNPVEKCGSLVQLEGEGLINCI